MRNAVTCQRRKSGRRGQSRLARCPKLRVVENLQGGCGRTAFQKGSSIDRAEKTSDGHAPYNATSAWGHQFEEPSRHRQERETADLAGNPGRDGRVPRLWRSDPLSIDTHPFRGGLSSAVGPPGLDSMAILDGFSFNLPQVS